MVLASLFVLNGLFALSELAVVSARHARLKAMAASGRPGAISALALSANPGRFLSAVQIGITLIGIINGAYSGETFGEYASAYLMHLGVSQSIANPLGYGAVIVVITYLSVIVGELVPEDFGSTKCGEDCLRSCPRHDRLRQHGRAGRLVSISERAWYSHI